MVKRVCDVLSRYMGLWVLVAGVVAMLWPGVFRWVPVARINGLLGVVMFGMGLSLKPSDFGAVLSHPRDVAVGCLAQFLIMPGLAWGLTRVFALPPELALGVVLVGCCPGGTASNVITYLAGGDLALSVSMTAMSTLLAPVVTPLLTWALAGKYMAVDAGGMFLSIVQVVILPIAGGLLLQRFLPELTRRVTVFLPAFSSLAIVFIVGIVVGHNAEKLWTSGLLVLVVVVLHNAGGLLLGYGAARLAGMERSKRIALSVEVGMQNSGLASALAALHFAAFPLATVPGAVFSVWHNISGALVAQYHTMRARRETARGAVD